MRAWQCVPRTRESKGPKQAPGHSVGPVWWGLGQGPCTYRSRAYLDTVSISTHPLSIWQAEAPQTSALVRVQPEGLGQLGASQRNCAAQNSPPPLALPPAQPSLFQLA